MIKDALYEKYELHVMYGWEAIYDKKCTESWSVRTLAPLIFFPTIFCHHFSEKTQVSRSDFSIDIFSGRYPRFFGPMWLREVMCHKSCSKCFYTQESCLDGSNQMCLIKYALRNSQETGTNELAPVWLAISFTFRAQLVMVLGTSWA